jgi:two-component system sensor histidine kinase UhpB
MKQIGAERTRCRQATGKLAASEERFQLVARATNDAVWDWDLATGALWWNEHVTTLFGYPKAEVRGEIEWWYQHLHPEDERRVVSGIHSTLDAGAQSWSAEYRFRRRDGSYAYVFDRGYVMRGKNGKPARMIGAMMDITKTKVAEEQLRRSHEELRSLAGYLQSVREEERSRMARELHDEIGQALTGIRLALEIYMREQGDTAERALRPAAALTNELIGKVRDLSLELRPAMLDDLGLLAALKWHFDRYTSQMKVRIDFTQTGLDQRRFDRELETAAYRIVQEALTNVARHAAVDRVNVSIWVDETRLCLLVQDRGQGFDVERISSNFRSGLSGMRERAALLGGRIRLDTAPGRGTRLLAELPHKSGNTAVETHVEPPVTTVSGPEK